jgi:phage terminase large subunit-like protein
MTDALFELHSAQFTIHNAAARFKVVSAGRRFGKTRLAVMECVSVANEGGRAWWVSPSYKTSEVGWRPLRQMARRIPGAEIKLVDKMVTLPGGGFVAVRSADNPDSLRGEGLDFVVMDECAFMQREAWTEAIRPALSDRLGKALFISTPKGRNWFWEAYQRGVRNEEGWQSFTYPTSANPFIDKGEIEAAKRDLPEIIFRQEYLAEFVDDQGGVFRRVQEAAVLQPSEPDPKRQYIAGVDVAASVDYTVVTVMDVESKEMVYMDRFNRVDYPVLIDRLESVYRRYGLTSMVVESNSIGRPVIDELVSRGLNIVPFTTTSATKQGIIQNLQSAFENGQIRVLDEPVLIGELLSFESKRNASGSFAYSAPDGMHDDTVMSLAIAWNGMRENVSVIKNPFYEY